MQPIQSQTDPFSGAVAARPGLVGPALVFGFFSAVWLWMAWFVTHLPWLGLHEQASLVVLLVVWFGAALAPGVGSARLRALKLGAVSGLITAAAGLLILGSKLAEPARAGDAAAGVVPSAGLIALGFLALGAAIGAAGALAGSLAPCPECSPRDEWLARFAHVTVFAVAPLLFVGGLVTSTNSGMAVPDWPNTYGSNMFLYPLGARTRPGVFLEHSHRLFGTLAGLATLVLTVWILAREPRRWVKTLALVALATVIVQGAIGGLRVLTGDTDPQRDQKVLRFVHGVLSQLTLGMVVTLAVVLAPSWRLAPDPGAPADPLLRRLRFFSTGLLHSTILQLIFGAMYRHFRDNHSRWTHIAFSIVVVIFAAAAGFVASAMIGGHPGLRPIVKRLGIAVVVVVGVQFALGWLTFVAGGTAQSAEGPVQALIRTAHQANGALLLGLATALFFWTKRDIRLSPTSSSPKAPAAAITPA